MYTTSQQMENQVNSFQYYSIFNRMSVVNHNNDSFMISRKTYKNNFIHFSYFYHF